MACPSRGCSRPSGTQRARGFVGQNILGSGFSFDIELRVGAGSYLCGEELTLLESLEGKRGYPRIKPPFPAQAGSGACRRSSTTSRRWRTCLSSSPKAPPPIFPWEPPTSPGTKIFCLSGDVNTPGYVEVEMGIPLRSLIEDFAGGVKGGGDPAGRPPGRRRRDFCVRVHARPAHGL